MAQGAAAFRNLAEYGFRVVDSHESGFRHRRSDVPLDIRSNEGCGRSTPAVKLKLYFQCYQQSPVVNTQQQPVFAPLTWYNRIVGCCGYLPQRLFLFWPLSARVTTT